MTKKINICMTVLFTLAVAHHAHSSVSRSTFRLVKSVQNKTFNVTRLDYVCVNIQVSISPTSKFTCAFICANPTTNTKGFLQGTLLQPGQLQCHYFSYNRGGLCILGLSNPGVSLPEQQVQDGLVVGISSIGGK